MTGRGNRPVVAAGTRAGSWSGVLLFARGRLAEALGEALQAEGAALLVLGEAGALHRDVIGDVGDAEGVRADIDDLGDLDDVAVVGGLVDRADLDAVGLHRLLEPMRCEHVPLPS